MAMHTHTHTYIYIYIYLFKATLPFVRLANFSMFGLTNHGKGYLQVVQRLQLIFLARTLSAWEESARLGHIPETQDFKAAIGERTTSRKLCPFGPSATVCPTLLLCDRLRRSFWQASAVSRRVTTSSEPHPVVSRRLETQS